MIFIRPERIEDFLNSDFEKVEVFTDDRGNLYGIRKGDLDLYWLRKERKEKLNKIIKEKKEKENEFLKDWGPFLDFEMKI